MGKKALAPTCDTDWMTSPCVMFSYGFLPVTISHSSMPNANTSVALDMVPLKCSGAM